MIVLDEENVSEINYKDALFKIESILNSKIVDIKFSRQPELSDGLSPILCGICEPLETNYSVDGGCIQFELDNGKTIVFHNSEWGGMTIYKNKEIANKECFDLKFEDIKNK
jgi:hypothetical protein